MTPRRPLKIVLLVGGLIVLPIVAFWLGWNLLDARNRANNLVSAARFDQLEAVLLAYHDEHGSFPPTIYQPVAGGPTHSWRVLVLSQLSSEQVSRYRSYDFSKKWNSRENREALGRIATGFRWLDNNEDTTHYLAIGEGDEWPSRKPLRSRLVTKGKDRFLLVEYPDSHIHWMEPKY